MSEADRRLLKLFARAYAEPESVSRASLKRSLRRWHNKPWFLQDDALTHFVVTTMAATPGDETRRRLRDLLKKLHRRPSMCADEVQSSLGVCEARDAVLRAIQNAFPSGPLVGRPLGEAVLDDEKGFREVREAEIEAARTAAEKLDWRNIPEGEIARAFAMNSVYIWIDGTSWPFYLPAFLCYALHDPGGYNCKYNTVQAVLDLPLADTMRRWTSDQRVAIARFIQFVAADEPWDATWTKHRHAVSTWLAMIP
jgi:hypothetical protein